MMLSCIQNEVPEGRKLYGTKSGEKYHFKGTRSGLNGYPNSEKKPRITCQGSTERIIDLTEGVRSDISATILGFEVRGEYYHDEDCTVFQTQRSGKDRKAMCGTEHQQEEKDEVI
jgi:hypothetical protein